MIGVSTESAELLRTAINRFGITHPIYNDVKEATFRAYGIMALPTLVLIGPDGVVRAVDVGGDLGAIEDVLLQILPAPEHHR